MFPLISLPRAVVQFALWQHAPRCTLPARVAGVRSRCRRCAPLVRMMSDAALQDDGREFVFFAWYLHLVDMAALQPGERSVACHQPFSDEAAADVAAWLAEQPVSDCVLLRGDGDHKTTDLLGIRWAEDHAEGRWFSSSISSCRKAYLQHYIAFLRCDCRLPPAARTAHARTRRAGTGNALARTRRCATLAGAPTASASSTFTTEGVVRIPRLSRACLVLWACCGAHCCALRAVLTSIHP